MRTFTSSSSAHRTKGTSQQASKFARSTALTDLESQRSIGKSRDPWTEVVQKDTGQVYYWNKQTSKHEVLSHAVTALVLLYKAYQSSAYSGPYHGFCALQMRQQLLENQSQALRAEGRCNRWLWAGEHRCWVWLELELVSG